MEVPNTLEEIKNKIAEIEEAQAKKAKKLKPKTIEEELEEAQQKIAELVANIPIPTAPIKVSTAETIYNPEVHITKGTAAIEVYNEIKRQKLFYTGSIITYLAVLGVGRISFYGGGVVALIAVGLTAYALAKVTTKGTYLTKTYDVK